MKHFKFNNDFMSNLDKIKKEGKAILTGDFNLNLYIYLYTQIPLKMQRVYCTSQQNNHTINLHDFRLSFQGCYKNQNWTPTSN